MGCASWLRNGSNWLKLHYEFNTPSLRSLVIFVIFEATDRQKGSTTAVMAGNI